MLVVTEAAGVLPLAANELWVDGASTFTCTDVASFDGADETT